MPGSAECGERVAPVVLSELAPADPAQSLALPCDLEGPVPVGRSGGPSSSDAEALDRAPSAFSEHSLQRRVLPIYDQQSGPRHDSHQVVKLSLDRCKIVE